jgi:hypothetical protein
MTGIALHASACMNCSSCGLGMPRIKQFYCPIADLLPRRRFQASDLLPRRPVTPKLWRRRKPAAKGGSGLSLFTSHLSPPERLEIRMGH